MTGKLIPRAQSRIEQLLERAHRLDRMAELGECSDRESVDAWDDWVFAMETREDRDGGK